MFFYGEDFTYVLTHTVTHSLEGSYPTSAVCVCERCSLTTVWCWCVLCLGLFELLESKPIVAVKVLLDSLSRAK